MSDDTQTDQAPTLPVGDILSRLQGLYKAKSEAELARTLGVPQSTLASWKQRGSMPFDKLLVSSAVHNVTLDWLIYGKGVEERVVMGDLDERLMGLAVRATLPESVVEERHLPTISRTIWFYYTALSNVVEQFRTSGKADRETAFKAAQDTAEAWRANVRLFDLDDGDSEDRK